MHDSFSRLLGVFRSAVPEADRPSRRELQVLAERLGVSSQTLTNWKARGVSKEGALQAEDTFGCSPGFILDGTDVPPRDGLARHSAAATAPSMSIGAAALAMALSLQDVADDDRDLIAQQIALMLRRGPSERLASAIDALATVDVLLQLSPPPTSSPLGVEFLDLDQEVAATLKDLAVASKTMTPTQRAAMVANLRGIEETPWDTTPAKSSGRTVRIQQEEPGTQPIYRRPGEGARTSKKVTK